MGLHKPATPFKWEYINDIFCTVYASVGDKERSSWKCTAVKIPFMYSFSGNCEAPVPISTFMCLWVIYIFPGSVHIFSCSRIGRSIVGIYSIYRSQTCMNVEIGTDAAQIFWENLFRIFRVFDVGGENRPEWTSGLPRGTFSGHQRRRSRASSSWSWQSPDTRTSGTASPSCWPLRCPGTGGCTQSRTRRTCEQKAEFRN